MARRSRGFQTGLPAQPSGKQHTPGGVGQSLERRPPQDRLPTHPQVFFLSGRICGSDGASWWTRCKRVAVDRPTGNAVRGATADFRTIISLAAAPDREGRKAAGTEGTEGTDRQRPQEWPGWPVPNLFRANGNSGIR